MRFLVAGLGSMGKRRIRCLLALGCDASDIAGFDPREDRRIEATEKYGIKTFDDFARALEGHRPGAMLISVPPDLHHGYIKAAIRDKIHFFVEASVVDTDMDLIENELAKIDIVAAPSATLMFHPAIRKISEVIRSGGLGKISNVILHSGQYLPDWHAYENVSDYYVSNPATGGGREIVPFELTWLTGVFGFPKRVCGNFRKTITIKGAESIDDTYNFLLDYENFLASVTVDVVSRRAVRRLLINGEKKQLLWDWDFNYVKIFDPEIPGWEDLPYEMGDAAPGYNANIGENMYIDEIRNFIEAIEANRPFVNTMDNDHRVLKLLYAIEESDKTSRVVRFS